MMHDTEPENVIDSSAGRLRLRILRFSAVEMFITLVLLFVATPFIEDLPGGELIEAILMSLFFLSAVLAVGARRGTLLVTALLAVPALVGKWLNHLQPQMFSPAIFLVSAIAFLAFIIIQILRFVLGTRQVNAEVLCASISVYLTLGLLWALAYRLVAFLTPTAFAFNSTQVVSQPMGGFTAFYFSFVTLSTVGYGDITPVSNVARMLAVMESMTGTLYVAVLIARLVALYSIPDPSNKSEPPRPRKHP
jgi:hypothetical protein